MVERMPEAIVYIDRSTIRSGKLEELRVAIDDLVGFIEAREPQLLHYAFHVDEERSQMTVVAVHPDTASVERHMDVGAEAFRAFADLIEMQGIEVYGPASERMLRQLEEKAADLGEHGQVLVNGAYAGFSQISERIDG